MINTVIQTSETQALPALPSALQTLCAQDEHAAYVARALCQMDDDALVELRGEVGAAYAAERVRFQEAVREHLLAREIADALLVQRIVDAGGKAIPHDRYDVHLEASKSIDKRIDVLRELDGLVPEDELQKAIYLDQPQPQWRADAAKLRALARKYGGKIAEIVGRGCVDTFGAPKLAFAPRAEQQKALDSRG